MAKPATVGVISQKDYLQKYLSGKNVDKKKKKRKTAKKTTEKRSVIVDDDEIKTMRELADGELDIFSMSEDAPQIAGIIDERPEELRTIETFRSSARWKVISDEYGIEDIRVVAVPSQHKPAGNSDDDLSPARNVRDDSDESPPRKRNDDASDESPPRKRNEDASDESLPRSKRRNVSDSDVSPPRAKLKSSGKRERDSDGVHDPCQRNKNEPDPMKLPRKPVSEDSLWGKKENRAVSPARNDRRKEAGNSRHSRRDGDNLEARRQDRGPQNIPNSRLNNETSLHNDRHASQRERGAQHHRQPKERPDRSDSPSRQGEKDRSERDHVRGDNKDGDFPNVRIKKEPASPSRKDPVGGRSRNDDGDEAASRGRGRKARESSTESPARTAGKVPRHRHELPLKKSSKKSWKDDSDESPHRVSKKGNPDEQQSRKHKKSAKDESRSQRQRLLEGQDSDESPPRKSRKHYPDSDESPPRSTEKKARETTQKSSMQARDDSDESPPRKSRKNQPDSDESPPRKPAKKLREKASEPTRKSLKQAREDADGSPLRKTDKKPREKAEKTSGRSSKHARKDLDESLPRKPEKQSRDGAVDSPSAGQGSWGSPARKARAAEPRQTGAADADNAPIYRDRKTGRKRDLEAEARQRKEDGAKTDVAKEKYTRWGAGLAQVAEREQRTRDALREAAKPLARRADDADLDAMLRARDREGDPMLDYLKAKATDVSVPSKPRYAGSFPPNRYGIAPGHRWDGVDRSTGFERRWFDGAAARQAVAEDAYKWSVADM